MELKLGLMGYFERKHSLSDVVYVRCCRQDMKEIIRMESKKGKGVLCGSMELVRTFLLWILIILFKIALFLCSSTLQTIIEQY